MGDMLDDFRWSLRLVRRRPTLAATIVVTLAAAIAAVTTAYGVAEAVLWRPLAFAAPHRLVFAWENVGRDGAVEAGRVTGSRFDEWQRGAKAFESLSLFGAAGFTMDGPAGVTSVRGVRVSPNYFDTLGISPLLGRRFQPADGEPGRERIVILSHGFWQQRLGGRGDVVGQSIRFSGVPYTVVGVMPPIVFPAWATNPAIVGLEPGFRQFWVPIAATPALAASSQAHVFGVVARIADGVSMQQAADDLDRLTDGADPDPHGAVLTPFREQFVRDARVPLVALLAAALAVLLVACTNLAALQGSATETRRAELSLRAALGAARARLARQLATETSLLAAAGGLLGLALSAVALSRVPDLLPPTVPLLTAPAIGGRGLLVAAGLSVLAGTALAAWPLARASRSASIAPRGAAPLARSRVFRSLVAGQVAIAMALIASAALLQQSLDTVRREDPGFAVEGVLVSDVSFTDTAYPDISRVVAAERRLASEVARIPGARAVAFAYDHPLEANWIDSFTLLGSAVEPDDVRGGAELRIVSPSYFRALGVDVLDGRAFTEDDDLDRPGVAVVNEAFARRAGGALVNRVVRSATPGFNWPDEQLPSDFRIVGIVEDERFKGLEAPSEPAVYLSTRQFPQRSAAILVRASVEPATLALPVRQAIHASDPGVPVGSFTTLAAILGDQLVERRATTHVINGFAGAALAVAALGLYGMLAMLVAARTRETGIRLALGASPSGVAGRVVRESLFSTVLGIAMGAGLTLLAGRVVQSLLVGVSPRDPVTIAAVALVMLVVAVAAAFGPAWRAAGVDPARVLRSET